MISIDKNIFAFLCTFAFCFSVIVLGVLGSMAVDWIRTKIESRKRRKQIEIVNAVIKEIGRRQGGKE